MADDVNQTTTQTPVQDDQQSVTQGSASQSDDSTAKPAAGAAQSNPLDVLEKLLDEIDQGKSSPSLSKKSLGTPGEPAQPEGPTPEEIAAEELEKRRIEFEQKQAEQQKIDQELIEQQRQVLAEEMEHGAANVARAQQDEEKKAQTSQKQQAEEGFEIVQLDHTKI